MEDNGKHIIIGVYSNDIIISPLPAIMMIMVWLQLDDIIEPVESFEFRANLNKNEFASGTFEVSVPAGKRATVSLGRFPLRIESEGDFSFDIRYANGGRWKNATTIQVKTTHSPTS
ncbi:MAG: hypothetical protein HC869_04210 [Rhodospirillales bacterium]|nr:hypothetical protein [Rhodospirillales bacterium]